MRYVGIYNISWIYARIIVILIVRHIGGFLKNTIFRYNCRCGFQYAIFSKLKNASLCRMHLFIISCKFHSFNQRISGIGVNENAIIFELQIPPAGLPQKSSNSLNNIIPRGALYRARCWPSWMPTVSVHSAGWNLC